MTRERIVILGGGVAGLATAWELAKRGGRGSSVVLLEQESAVGRHSSGRSASILRTATGDPLQHEVAARGADLLRGAQKAFGLPLVDPRGVLLTADAVGAPALENMLAHARVEFERLADPVLPWDRRRPVLAARFPHEGRIESEALVAGLARLAQEEGVWLETRARVRGLTPGRSSTLEVVLEDAAPIPADRVVIAAGGWSEELGNGAGSAVSLIPTRRHVAVLLDRGDVPADAPVVWHTGDDEFYYRPEGDGLMVCACDQTHVSAPPPVDPRIEEFLVARSAKHLSARPTHGADRLWSGCRTLTADGRYCLGADPDVDGLFWVAGLGGSGMTAGLEIGRLAAAWMGGSDEDRELREAFAPSRLAGVPAR